MRARSLLALRAALPRRPSATHPASGPASDAPARSAARWHASRLLEGPAEQACRPACDGAAATPSVRRVQTGRLGADAEQIGGEPLARARFRPPWRREPASGRSRTRAHPGSGRPRRHAGRWSGRRSRRRDRRPDRRGRWLPWRSRRRPSPVAPAPRRAPRCGPTPPGCSHAVRRMGGPHGPAQEAGRGRAGRRRKKAGSWKRPTMTRRAAGQRSA